MAHKRMFSKSITDSDAFREMPASAQSLYFHIGMQADDDGFIDNYRSLMRAVNASEDDLKILIGKRFLILFPSKVLVVKHWRINNIIRLDRYTETKHLEEKRALLIKENGAYTEDLSVRQPNGNQVAPQNRIEENRKEKTGEPKGSHLFKAKFNPEDDKAPEKEAKDPRVKKITADFRARCKKEYGREPAWGNPMGWKAVKSTLEKISEAQVKEMMDIWFEASHEPDKGMRITQCFSAFQIDKYLNES